MRASAIMHILHSLTDVMRRDRRFLYLNLQSRASFPDADVPFVTVISRADEACTSLTDAVDDVEVRRQQSHIVHSLKLVSERQVYPMAAYTGPYMRRDDAKELLALEALYGVVEEAVGHAQALARRQVHLMLRDTGERIGSILLEARTITHIRRCVL